MRVLAVGSLVLLGCGGNVTTTPAGGSGSGGAATTTTSSTTTSTSSTTSTTSSSSDAGGCSPTTGCPCALPAECGAGYACDDAAPGGYCMPGSPGAPTACHDPDAPCPTGTVCSPVPWSQISGVCLRACQTSADCRAGHVCNVVALFPGDPGTPTSPAPVCWTACQPGADQTCNDSPFISSIHGTCLADGTCQCAGGFAKNPATGRCL